MRKGQRLPMGTGGWKRPLLLPSETVRIDRVELAWAAGFFDGEGSTYVHGKKKHPKISITQAPDPDSRPPAVLHRFYRAVGEIGSVEGPYREKTGELKWFYTAHGAEMVQAVVALIWEWLGTIKRRQATTALRAHREIHHGERNPGVRFGRPLNTVCKRGHDYTDIVLNSRGNRMCRPCVNVRARDRMRLVRAAWAEAVKDSTRLGASVTATRPRPQGTCRRGHDRSDAALNSAGQWECRSCKNLTARERSRRKREATIG